MVSLKKPSIFDDMVKLAEQLSEGMPHVRVDLYSVNNSIYFGEYTFYHYGGIIKFNPELWDNIFGSWLKLPAKLDNT